MAKKFLNCLILIVAMALVVPSAAHAARGRVQSHDSTYDDQTGKFEPDDIVNGTTNEAGDQRPLFYFDEEEQVCVDTTSDTDGDGIGDHCDNCIFIPNPGQEEPEGSLTGGGAACDGDPNKRPAADTTAPATPDEGGEEGGGETQPTPGAGFLADEGGSCTLVPGSANAAASPILLLVAMSIAILTIRRKVVD